MGSLRVSMRAHRLGAFRGWNPGRSACRAGQRRAPHARSSSPRGDRDATLNRHPIRPHPPPLAARIHFARQLQSTFPGFPARWTWFSVPGCSATTKFDRDRPGWEPNRRTSCPWS